jgi:A/G-specific adenine glycosylase
MTAAALHHKSKSFADADGAAAGLLAWYDGHARELPWRVPPGAVAAGTKPDPYRVWLSEIMLQQTTVEAVKPYFRKFVDRWPDIGALAATEGDEVMKAWAGLGYYSRARNLLKCAAFVAGLPGRRFPDTEAGLRALPGVGPYTAAAVAAIAFDRPAAVVDGNVERVIARLFAIRTPLPAAKEKIRSRAATMVPKARPGDFAQAMMDLGATICTPRRPRCALCPLRSDCRAIREGDPEPLPVRTVRAERPRRRGAAFVAVRPDGAILLRRRPGRGLLGGMTEVPTTGWTARGDGATTPDAAPFPAAWQRIGAVSHVFTHFALELDVFLAQVEGAEGDAGCFWSARDEASAEALPSLMKKVIEAAVPGSMTGRNSKQENT